MLGESGALEMMSELEETEERIPVAKPIEGVLTGLILQVTTRYSNAYEYDVTVKRIGSGDGSKGGNGEYELVEGYAVDIFFYLQTLLNFTYVLRPDITSDILFGDSPSNSSIDLYVASSSLLPSRAKLLEPTFVTGQSKIYAFMDHDFESDSANQNLFVDPFAPLLWLWIGIMLGLVLLTFLFFNYFERDSSMGDILFHCVSLTLQKGSDVPTFHDSTRLAAITLSLAVVVIMASYSGIMTSVFAVTRYSITSVESLLNSNYKIMIELGTSSNSSTVLYMLQALIGQMPMVKTLLEKADRSKFTFVSFNQSIEEVKRVPSAYIIDEETGLETISLVFDGFPCSWSKLPVFNLQYPWSMYMRKNASFQKEINAGLVRIRERGVLRRIRKKWINNPALACYTGSEVIVSGITFSQISGALRVILVVIIIISPAIFLGEKFTAVITFLRKRRVESDVFTVTIYE